MCTAFNYLPILMHEEPLIVTFLPYYEMATAGFAATVTNYYYPIIFALWILAFVYSSKKNSIFIVVLSAVLSIYSCNHEQSLVIVILFTFPKVFDKDNINKTTAYTVITIALLSLISTIMCPGNATRIVIETQNWMPEFASFSLFDKIYMGMTTALYKITYLNNLPFIFCFAAITLAITNKLLWCVIALVFNAIYRMPIRSIFKSLNLEENATWLKDFPLSNFVLLISLVILISVLCLFTRTDIKTKISLCVLIALAYALRTVVGFSPTVFSSGVRPEIFSQILLVVTGFYALTKSNIDTKKISLFVIVFSIYNFIKFIYPIPFNIG